MRMLQKSLTAIIGGMAGLGLMASAASAGDTTVVPQQYLNTNAPAGLNSVLRDAPNARTYQCVYGASELGDITPGQQITGITWRQYSGGAAAWPSVDANWTQYDVYLSTSNNAPGSLSTTFAANEGADRVLCHSGPVTMPAGSFPAGSNPPADRFGYVIQFTSPFTYNGGDLCVTIRHTGNDTATNAFVCNGTNYGTGVHAGYATTYDGTTMAFTYTGPIVAQLTYGGGGGFTAELTGTCPGTVRLAWSGAPANKPMGIVFAQNTGSFTINSGPCAGTQLGLGTQQLQLYNTINTGNGSGAVNAQAGPGACGGYVQLVAVDSPCKTSNVVQVP